MAEKVRAEMYKCRAAPQTSTQQLLNLYQDKKRTSKWLFIQTSLFRTPWRSSSLGELVCYSFLFDYFCNLFNDVLSENEMHALINVTALFLPGVNSTCWRGNAALEWRSWKLSLKNTCRTGSPCQTSWRRQSVSSRWERRCCHTTVTPNIQGTFCACFLMLRRTWLRCAADEDQEWTIKSHRIGLKAVFMLWTTSRFCDANSHCVEKCIIHMMSKKLRFLALFEFFDRRTQTLVKLCGWRRE